MTVGYNCRIHTAVCSKGDMAWKPGCCGSGVVGAGGTDHVDRLTQHHRPD